MPKSQDKPIFGALLGVALGVVAVLILQQGAVVPPTRLVVFGILGFAASGGSLLLTVAYRSRAVVAVQSVAVLFVAFALTGISAMSDEGSLEGGCMASAQSSRMGTAVPGDTSVRDPLTIDTDGTIAWLVGTPAPLTDWSYEVRVDLAGFPIVVWSDSDSKRTIGPSWEGSEDMGERIGELEDLSGVAPTGVYHVLASIRGAEGACDADVYVRIVPDSLFSGPILVGLWTAAAIGSLVFVVYFTQVRRARVALTEMAPTEDGTQ